MTATTAETLTVNGVLLNTYAKNIESLTGRLRVPGLRTDNIVVPARHGTLRTTRKFYDEGQIILPMWVKGCDDDGNIPTTARQMFYTNLDVLSKLFRPGDGMLEVLHTLPDATVRRCMAEVTEVIDNQVSGYGNPLGKFSVAMRVPSVFWEDAVVRSVDLLPTQNGPVPILDGATAPIEDAVFTITGPATNPKVEALYNGASLSTPVYFQYSGTVAAGKTLAVDCGNWTLVGGGFSPDFSLFSHVGSARWMTIPPGPIGSAPSIKITASSTSGATKVNLSARRKFLVG